MKKEFDVYFFEAFDEKELEWMFSKMRVAWHYNPG